MPVTVAPQAAMAQTSQTSQPTTRVAPLSARAMAITPLCPVAGVGPDVATCNGLLRTDVIANAEAVVAPNLLPGIHPAALRNAYGLADAASAGIGQTVAVVVAYHNALLPMDLAIYRAEFGLPPCTVASGCLRYAAAGEAPIDLSPAWSAESDLDVEMVSAICPNCKIIVSEAPSDQIGDLAHAVHAAVAAGATVVSNSYSTTEDAASLKFDRFYDVPGVPMTAGAGDNGYGVSYPASSKHVTAVGGTTLTLADGVFSSEAAWSSTGSGCSAIVSKPWWQYDGGCPRRTTNDVAVVGDPATGVAVYLTAFGGWNVLGGTSVGAPVVAAMYALAGNGASISAPAYLYGHRADFRPIAGSTATCVPTYLCTASNRYNGPAGLGTPYGLGAF